MEATVVEEGEDEVAGLVASVTNRAVPNSRSTMLETLSLVTLEVAR